MGRPKKSNQTFFFKFFELEKLKTYVEKRRISICILLPKTDNATALL